MRGKILSSKGNVYVVLGEDGIFYNVFPRGLLKFRNKNVMVGDECNIDDENFSIEDILPRKNSLIRPKVSNVDQIFVMMSVKRPELSKELIFKFLTYVNMNNVEPKLILTKYDLLEDKSIYNDFIDELNKLGVEVFLISKYDESSISLLKEKLKNKTSMFMGQTGVGKSSFINMLDASFERKEGEYSEVLHRGKHQTKEVILLPYEGGYIIDTPGFSSLDLDISKHDLAHFFPGFSKLYTSCFYTDCLHKNEKNCKIKEEMANNLFSDETYNIYLKLLEELPFERRKY
ncbi:MAG: ribosome small subunit-dependent GTPase A [Erysipelotrichaceae bacterium]|nr:ribosome small subunit-dependent GTPase A [Erysipelotrichaceae bacterium]